MCSIVICLKDKIKKMMRRALLFFMHPFALIFFASTFYLNATFSQVSTDIALLCLHFNILLTLLASALPLLDYAATQGGSRVVDAN